MRRPHPLRLLRRASGGLLLAVLLLPVHRLLEGERAGPAAAATRDVADALGGFAVWGSISLLLAALVLGLLAPAHRLRGALDRVRSLLLTPSTAGFALLLQVTSTTLAAAAAWGVHRRLPRLVDAMAQLLHARAFAEGSLTVPAPLPAGRVILNGVLLPEGWASVYAPGHTVLLALGDLAGAAWLVGPVLLGATAAFTFLAVDALYPERPGTARLAGILVASSPFLIFLGGGYLSHVSAAAGLSAALYFAVLAWRGRPWWALPAGAAAAFAVTARPWSGLVLGGFLTGGLWLARWWREGRSLPWLIHRGGWAALGGLPFGVALLAYDARLFGSPFRLGYELAFGPDHGLGFHPDPWGNAYGLREALGYTAADLTGLGLHLFETPVSALLPLGVFLLFAPRLSPPTRILAGWCFLSVAANALYWHHGYHLGPRMLMESGPAWAALVAVATVGLVEGCRDPAAPGGVERAWSRLLPPAVVIWGSLLAVVTGAFSMLPTRLETYRWDPDELARNVLPRAEEVGDALIFVHGSWAGRTAARLVAAGMRRDSVETALRRNGLCRVHLYAEARAGAVPSGRLPPLDLERRPGSPSFLRTVEIGGVPARLEPTPLSPPCAREAAADRRGVVELAPLLWQTALPGSGDGPLLYRDLGPEENARVIARFPERTPVVLVPTAPDGTVEILPYEETTEMLWSGGSAGRAPGPRGPGEVSGRPGPG